MVRHLIALRNWQEHPGPKRTVVENFALMPNDTISPPVWHLSGETEPSPVGPDMRAAAGFLVEISEAMLILLVLDTVDKRFPFVIQEYETERIDPKKPIRYRLSADLTRLNIKPGPAG